MKKQTKYIVAGVTVAVAAGVGWFVYNRSQAPAPPTESSDAGPGRRPAPPRGPQQITPPGREQGTSGTVSSQTPQAKPLPAAAESKCGGKGYWPRLRVQQDVRQTITQITGQSSNNPYWTGNRGRHPAVAQVDALPLFKGNFSIAVGNERGNIFNGQNANWPANRFEPSEIIGTDANGEPIVAYSIIQGEPRPIIGFVAEDCPAIGEGRDWKPVFGSSMGYVGGYGYNQDGNKVAEPGDTLPGEPGVYGYWLPASTTEPYLQPQKITSP